MLNRVRVCTTSVQERHVCEPGLFSNAKLGWSKMSHQVERKSKPGYKTLEFNVRSFVPSMHVFYNYHQILKRHNFIQDVRLINRNNELTLEVERLRP